MGRFHSKNFDEDWVFRVKLYPTDLPLGESPGSDEPVTVGT